MAGSGLDDWIYCHFNYNYNQLWQLTIHGCRRLAPFLTGLRVSPLLLWLTWFWFTNRSLIQLPLSAGKHSTAEHWTFLRLNYYLFVQSQSQSYITTDGQSASLSWNNAHIWGLRPDLYCCQTVAGFVHVGRSFWREDGSVVYKCCWSSPAQSFSDSSCCLRFETSIFVASTRGTRRLFFSAGLLIWATGNSAKRLLPVCCHGSAPCTELVWRDLLSHQRVLIPSLFVATETCLRTRCLAMDYSVRIELMKNVIRIKLIYNWPI
jgi:hypothetical protein